MAGQHGWLVEERCGWVAGVCAASSSGCMPHEVTHHSTCPPLQAILEEEELKDSVILVYANKQARACFK